MMIIQIIGLGDARDWAEGWWHIDSRANAAVNDFPYIKNSVLGQTADDILKTPVPKENQQTMFKILDYITED